MTGSSSVGGLAEVTAVVGGLRLGAGVAAVVTLTVVDAGVVVADPIIPANVCSVSMAMYLRYFRNMLAYCSVWRVMRMQLGKHLCP